MGVTDMTIQSFKIGHHNYAVKYQDHIKTESGDLLDGQCNKHSKVISISNDFENKDYQTAVLMHEVIHGLIYESGYAFASAVEEEDFAYLFGKALHGFLKDNIDTLNEMYRKPELFISSEAISKAVARAKDGYHSTVAGESILDLKAEVSD